MFFAMRSLVFLLCLFFSPLSATAAGQYPIVFIHIGEKIPSYAATAISQAALFNGDDAIILLANQKALEDFKLNFPHLSYQPISCESLKMTKEHREFLQLSTLDPNFRDGFWKYASERFLYLYDLIEEYDLQNVFHLEYDVMLYVNLESLLPILQKNYPGIGATFDNDERCIPGFVYISQKSAMKKLAKFFAMHANSGWNDMQVLGAYKSVEGPQQIQNLPVIMPEYLKNNALVSPSGHTVKNTKLYSCYFEEFQSIFDAAALGQYLGGIDPRNGESKPGFINESCVFNPSLLRFIWEQDSQGRWIPFAIFGKTCCRINNLHIHSKKLENFISH
jgi:hypothetical protein